MFWGQALIEFRRTNKARSWPNFRAWHLKTDSKSAFATSLVGSRSPPLTTSFGISAFDMSRGTHPPTLPMSSRMHHFPNRRPSDHRIAPRNAQAGGVASEARRGDSLLVPRDSLPPASVEPHFLQLISRSLRPANSSLESLQVKINHRGNVKRQ